MDIVVGVDGSPSAEPTLDAGAEEAQLRKATLHVIHVVYVPSTLVNGVTFMPGNVIDSSYEFAERVRKSVWERVTAQLEGSGLKWIQVDRSGYPPDEIVDYAESIAAGLIVVGSRGLGEFKSLLLGSTSHRVSHLAGCNVLIVKTPQ
jgi:nucleotide-binding universal stress UspA family protein